jgi:hypothetical protein
MVLPPSRTADATTLAVATTAITVATSTATAAAG